MALLHIIILALVQGITEFLPISSSGHLLIISPLTGWPDQGQVLDIAVHVGTLVAVILYFRRDIGEIARALLTPGRPESAPALRLFGHVLVASIPAVIAGGLLYFLVTLDMRSILLVAMTTIIFGILLGWADKSYPVNNSLRKMNHKDALIIGLFQIFSLLPGTSRSGVTMMAARMRGFDRTEGAHFSMLLSIPTIMGAGTLGTLSLLDAGNAEFNRDAILAAGISFVFALAAISLLMAWISRIGFMPFVIYRLALGALLLGVYFLG
ncbi:undecaprenyl-diphosphate phosphatase [Sneathiella marina]|uniref:Undecaprenyl-diphosphatase n=1 Tax=Sneathiella marina TaxID=2950108 RepID=A0ABY4W3H0_9PROT|nr:undecaprenyl-diphosphate phosphatase [Sneathiella marina]USG60437.1 undecaprenyl-diphosphate phosphatase [Sneathiella marina]